MKNRKWIYLLIIILIALGYSFLDRPQNNIETMERMISKHIKTNQTVTIYNAIHVEDYRLVSYILETKDRFEKVGYANFILNSKGKYELLNIVNPDRVIEKGDDITIYEFSNLKSQSESVKRMMDLELKLNNVIYENFI